MQFSRLWKHRTSKDNHEWWRINNLYGTFKGPFIYYVSTCRGEGGSKNANFCLFSLLKGKNMITCFIAFAFHFHMLGQFSFFVKLSKQVVKWKLRYRRSKIWKNFGLVTKQKVHKIVKTCKKLRHKEIFLENFFFLSEKFY